MIHYQLIGLHFYHLMLVVDVWVGNKYAAHRPRDGMPGLSPLFEEEEIMLSTHIKFHVNICFRRNKMTAGASF